MPAADAVGFAALFDSHEARRSMTERRNFAKSKYSMEIPFLLEVQVESFNRFLQIPCPGNGRTRVSKRSSARPSPSPT